MKSKNVDGSNQPTGPEAATSGEPRLQNVPGPEEIQQRAYEINMERGGAHGQDVDDWLQAELELEAKYRIG
jgi:Protein of unknown function (DUF2934)